MGAFPIGDAIAAIVSCVGLGNSPLAVDKHRIGDADMILAAISIPVGVNPGVIIHPLRPESVFGEIGEIEVFTIGSWIEGKVLPIIRIDM